MRALGDKVGKLAGAGMVVRGATGMLQSGLQLVVPTRLQNMFANAAAQPEVNPSAETLRPEPET